MSIGRNIARLRKRKGLTQEELAEKAEITRGYLANIEIGKERASIRVLARIANLLNVDITSLLKKD